MNNDMVFVYVLLGCFAIAALIFVSIAIALRKNEREKDKLMIVAAVFGMLFAITLSAILVTPKCPNCNTKVPTVYCTTCGAAVREIVPECPNCNEKCSTQFCGKCGTKIEENH